LRKKPCFRGERKITANSQLCAINFCAPAVYACRINFATAFLNFFITFMSVYLVYQSTVIILYIIVLYNYSICPPIKLPNIDMGWGRQFEMSIRKMYARADSKRNIERFKLNCVFKHQTFY
jgi:hypothetical protein